MRLPAYHDEFLRLFAEQADFYGTARNVQGGEAIELSFYLDDADRMLNRLSPEKKFEIGKYIWESVTHNNLIWVEEVLINRVGIVAARGARLDLEQAREIGYQLLYASGAMGDEGV